MRKNFLLSLVICIGLISGYLLASTTFTTSRDSYYGVEAKTQKLSVAVTPVHREDPNDHNDVNSVAASDAVYGELKRITLSATGDDVDFIINVKDGDGVTLFSKIDCNTVQMPLSYALDMNNSIATRYPGVFVAGPVTVETNNVDPVNLTAINVTLYYQRF